MFKYGGNLCRLNLNSILRLLHLMDICESATKINDIFM